MGSDLDLIGAERGVIMTIVLLDSIWTFRAFDPVYVMTGGGPVDATNVIVLYLYEQAFRFFRMGYASAVAYVLFVFIFGLTLVQFYLLRSRMEIYK